MYVIYICMYIAQERGIMASGQPMVSSLFAQDSVNPLSFLKKSYGDGRVVSVAGIR